MTMRNIPARIVGAVGGRLAQWLLNDRLSQVEAHLRFPEVVVPSTSLSIPTRVGPTRVTVYTPPAGERPGRPGVYVNFHGGGYLLGDYAMDDPICRCIAAWAGVVVINVDYVLAPQYPFPAAVHQCFDLVDWVHRKASAHGWDGDRLSIGGQSAGGGIAAAVARQALEAGGPAISVQVLHYPPLDLATPTASKRAGTPKAVITPMMGILFNAAYVPDRASRVDPLASPVYSTAQQLQGIAQALVITPEFDRLHDEGARYASLLDEVGALLDHHDVLGVDHGYNLFGGSTEQVREVYELIARTIAAAGAPA